MIEIQNETVYEALLMKNCPSQMSSVSTLSTFEIGFYDTLHHFLNEKRPTYDEAYKILAVNKSFMGVLRRANISQVSSVISRNIAGVRLKNLSLLAKAPTGPLTFDEHLPRRTQAEELVLILAKEYLLTVRDYARITPNLAVAHFLICSEMAEVLSYATPMQVMNLAERTWTILQFELTAPVSFYVQSIERSNVYSTDSKRRVFLSKIERELHSTTQCFGEGFHEPSFN